MISAQIVEPEIVANAANAALISKALKNFVDHAVRLIKSDQYI
jgi:hypothetical protein